MSAPLYLEDLSRTPCMHPQHKNEPCDEMVVSGRCHPAKPTRSKFLRARGVLEVSCAQCGKTIVEIAVARRGPRMN
jgi:hypothetical protein